jgi:hypothetical protein
MFGGERAYRIGEILRAVTSLAVENYPKFIATGENTLHFRLRNCTLKLTTVKYSRSIVNLSLKEDATINE